MSQDNKKIDWSEERWKEMLVYQRKFMWLEDTLDKLAVWLDLKPGMTAVDVGCGLGYLGYTYWHYFGDGGHYIGIDISTELIQDAAKAAKQWAERGRISCVVGDAYQLPFPDDFADCVMCQTLLMHLKEPKLALAEMIRVAKPGGLIMCTEPDNLSFALARHFWSVPESDMDEELLFKKIYIICEKGRIKLGRGDSSIGPKVPRMMKQLGLVNLEIRMNDIVTFLEPPYEGPLQQHQFDRIKKQWLPEDEKTYEFWMDRQKEEFLAGGGNPEEFDRYRKIADRIRPIYKQQLKKGEFFVCTAGPIYIIKGKKRWT